MLIKKVSSVVGKTTSTEPGFPQPERFSWEYRSNLTPEEWGIRSDTIYLNHGSFGPPPPPIRDARAHWQAALDTQPMDFFVRQYETQWRAAQQQMATWLRAHADDCTFVENATYGMNVVADSLPLRAGDEVLLTDHEYGAVLRIWQRACRRVGAAEPRIARLPQPLGDPAEVVDAVVRQMNDRTRLVVVSHITSATAVILPVAELIQAAHARGVAVCVDGPHAPAQIPLNLQQLNCDYYTASCHKWLSAPFGSGFLYVAPAHQATIRAPLLSWGRLSPAQPTTWYDEFIWSGTRDAGAFFAVPTAIELFERFGAERFREQTHQLARYARQRLVELTGLEPLVPDSPNWYGTMAHVPIPAGDRQVLQDALWQRHRIEVPIVSWDNRRWIRVSCHLYNHADQIDTLIDALQQLLRAGL